MFRDSKRVLIEETHVWLLKDQKNSHVQQRWWKSHSYEESCECYLPDFLDKLSKLCHVRDILNCWGESEIFTINFLLSFAFHVHRSLSEILWTMCIYLPVFPVQTIIQSWCQLSAAFGFFTLDILSIISLNCVWKKRNGRCFRVHACACERMCISYNMHWCVGEESFSINTGYMSTVNESKDQMSL